MNKKLPFVKKIMLKMQGVMMKAMISCDEASRLASKSLDTKLSTSEKMRLKMHLMACRFCRSFEKQIHAIRSIIRSKSKEIPEDTEEKALTTEARARLENSIKENK
jgi:predicted anti-sigma-YlaC factor YlaD